MFLTKQIGFVRNLFFQNNNLNQINIVSELWGLSNFASSEAKMEIVHICYDFQKKKQPPNGMLGHHIEMIQTVKILQITAL